MGIDIYLTWKGMTRKEKKAQDEAVLSYAYGHVGYLRESSLNIKGIFDKELGKKIESLSEHYATKVLCREVFERKIDEPLYISSKTLRKRLPHTIEIVKERRLKAYDEVVEENHPVIKSFIDFVELAERLEREGREIRIICTDYAGHNKTDFVKR